MPAPTTIKIVWAVHTMKREISDKQNESKSNLDRSTHMNSQATLTRSDPRHQPWAHATETIHDSIRGNRTWVTTYFEEDRKR